MGDESAQQRVVIPEGGQTLDNRATNQYCTRDGCKIVQSEMTPEIKAKDSIPRSKGSDETIFWSTEDGEAGNLSPRLSNFKEIDGGQTLDTPVTNEYCTKDGCKIARNKLTPEIIAKDSIPRLKSTDKTVPCSTGDGEVGNFPPKLPIVLEIEDALGYDCQSLIEWASKVFGKGLAMSTSFGIHSAATLHLVTRICPDIPVVWIDTGFLPPETYLFAEQLATDYKLNLKVYQPQVSARRLESLYGQLWKQSDVDSQMKYAYLTKVEPMRRAVRELNITAIIAGVRAEQTSHREQMSSINLPTASRPEYKICPILKWTKQNLEDYMHVNEIPFHPLKAKGYETVGDYHSSRPMTDKDSSERLTRFQGKAEECGLHLDIDFGGLQIAKKHVPEHTNDSAPVIIYTKPSCRFCKAAKNLLESKHISFLELQLGQDTDYQSLVAKIGHDVETVPQIFMDGSYVGGYEQLVRTLRSEQVST